MDFSKITCLAFDLDGTLLQTDKTMDAKTAEAIRRLQKAGKHVVLASGRPLRGMIDYGLELGFDHFESALVAMNGGHGYDYEDGSTFLKVQMDQSLAETYLSEWQGESLFFALYGEKTLYSNRSFVAERKATKNNPEMKQDSAALEVVPVMSIAEVPEAPFKVCMVGPREELEKEEFRIREKYEGKLYMAYSGEQFLEAMPTGVNKGVGLTAYAKRRNVKPEEILAFGDQENDIPMLSFAGYSCAMEGGVDGAKAVADEVIGSNDQQGIYHFLKNAFPEIVGDL